MGQGPPRFHGAIRRVLHRGACEVPSQNGAILAVSGPMNRHQAMNVG